TMLKVIYKNAEKNGMEWFNQSNVDVDGANFTCNIPGTDKNNYDNPEKYAEKVFSKIGLISAGQYKIIKKDDKIFFYLTFDGKIIFDSYIYIKVKDNKITEIFGSNCLGDKVTEGSMAKVVSPAEILINFASEYGEPGKMRITNIESGYFAGKRTKAVKITAAPVWKAKTSDGKVFYFDMRNGDLLE
ncbi:MAG: two-component system regulatory protein YycI, partial [Clostridia bacterium]|nr:two-component system regulatory protein YycI [Clostridia bacterium]